MIGSDKVGLDEAVMNGAELKALRKKLGLSLSQASRQVEVSVRTWARWESGVQNIPLGAIKLFKILNNVQEDKWLGSGTGIKRKFVRQFR